MEYIQICCLEKTHPETTVPPSTFIYVGIGYESHSTNMCIPSKNDLTSEIDTSIRYEFFIDFNDIYQNKACSGS